MYYVRRASSLIIKITTRNNLVHTEINKDFKKFFLVELIDTSLIDRYYRYAGLLENGALRNGSLASQAFFCSFTFYFLYKWPFFFIKKLCAFVYSNEIKALSKSTFLNECSLKQL